MALRHHDLCFGCGQTNLFGLLAEIERRDQRSVAGRCFIKQDHQGPAPGSAHPGVVASGLIETMLLAAGGDARLLGVQIEFTGQATVGTFLELEAELGEDGRASARARADMHDIAAAVGFFTHGPQLR